MKSSLFFHGTFSACPISENIAGRDSSHLWCDLDFFVRQPSRTAKFREIGRCAGGGLKNDDLLIASKVRSNRFTNDKQRPPKFRLAAHLGSTFWVTKGGIKKKFLSSTKVDCHVGHSPPRNDASKADAQKEKGCPLGATFSYLDILDNIINVGGECCPRGGKANYQSTIWSAFPLREGGKRTQVSLLLGRESHKDLIGG